MRALAEQIVCAETVADIGCDHGRLSVALLQEGRARRVIASDISAVSLKKAECLANASGLSDSLSLHCASGLSHLQPGEADTLVFAGMGGEHIVSLLAADAPTARAAKYILLQPMGGVIELRQYLALHNYRVVHECLVRDAGRIYHLLTAENGVPLPLPQGFPVGEHAYGPLLFHKHDPLLIEQLRTSRASHARRLLAAERKGQRPEALLRILRELDALIEWEEQKFEAE